MELTESFRSCSSHYLCTIGDGLTAFGVEDAPNGSRKFSVIRRRGFQIMCEKRDHKKYTLWLTVEIFRAKRDASICFEMHHKKGALSGFQRAMKLPLEFILLSLLGMIQ
jgi:hypothetical protein